MPPKQDKLPSASPAPSSLNALPVAQDSATLSEDEDIHGQLLELKRRSNEDAKRFDSLTYELKHLTEAVSKLSLQFSSVRTAATGSTSTTTATTTVSSTPTVLSGATTPPKATVVKQGLMSELVASLKKGREVEKKQEKVISSAKQGKQVDDLTKDSSSDDSGSDVEFGDELTRRANTSQTSTTAVLPPPLPLKPFRAVSSARFRKAKKGILVAANNVLTSHLSFSQWFSTLVFDDNTKNIAHELGFLSYIADWFRGSGGDMAEGAFYLVVERLFVLHAAVVGRKPLMRKFLPVFVHGTSSPLPVDAVSAIMKSVKEDDQKVVSDVDSEDETSEEASSESSQGGRRTRRGKRGGKKQRQRRSRQHRGQQQRQQQQQQQHPQLHPQQPRRQQSSELSASASPFYPLYQHQHQQQQQQQQQQHHQQQHYYSAPLMAATSYAQQPSSRPGGYGAGAGFK